MNPYEVLGVSSDADEETIKKAYRTLVKKYHPDRYVNTPMAEVASEKMKQINEAYDMLTNKNNSHNQRQSGYGGYNPYGSYNSGSYTNVSFESVRGLIAMRRLAEAESMLLKLPQNAEWNYLMGVVFINRGWYNKGIEYINRAIQLDPTNSEYQAARDSFNANNERYKNVVFSTNNASCGVCPSLCIPLCLSQLLCGRMPICCYC